MRLDDRYKWSSELHGRVAFHYSHGFSLKPELIEATMAPHAEANLRARIADYRPGFALVVEAPTYLFAAVDQLRSIPVFYHSDSVVTVSNSARLLRREAGLQQLDPAAVLEVRMAGYVTGRDTVIVGLRQLQPGEYLYWDRIKNKTMRERYFRYVPAGCTGGDRELLVEQLGENTDAIFRRLVRNTEGLPIWVPLSGGLDSRLVICKLKEHGADRIQAFSYGPRNNHEAKTAAEVAERLDVPWFHRAVTKREARTFFESTERREYWRFADQLSTVPSMAEALILIKLRREGVLPPEAVIVNGQTGDFISGGHIPSPLMERAATLVEAIEAVIDKHYSLWTDLKTPDNRACIRDRIQERMKGAVSAARLGDCNAASVFESWEWQERQCKNIINGQRLYDYLGLAWKLPLWDQEYLAFWQGVPVELRFKQRLYKSYLREYDYRDLFHRSPPRFPPRSTPGKLYLPVHGLAKLSGLIGGRQLEETIRSYARYLGQYSGQYQSYPLARFLRHGKCHRNPVSFFAETWVEELITMDGLTGIVGPNRRNL